MNAEQQQAVQKAIEVLERNQELAERMSSQLRKNRILGAVTGQSVEVGAMAIWGDAQDALELLREAQEADQA